MDLFFDCSILELATPGCEKFSNYKRFMLETASIFSSLYIKSLIEIWSLIISTVLD